MIGVPNLSVVVNFCDWLDKKLSETGSSDDFIDYAYDEEHYKELRQYAQEYLRYYHVYEEPECADSVREFFHRYIDSCAFSQHLQEYFLHFNREFLTKADMDAEEKIWRFWKGFFWEFWEWMDWRYDRMFWREWEDEFKPAAERLLEELSENAERPRVRVIHSDSLATMYQRVFRDMKRGQTGFASGRESAVSTGHPARKSSPMIRLMTKCQTTLKTESDFLNFFEEPVDFSAMPKKRFERIVDDYLQKSGDRISNPEFVRKRLIKCFTQSKMNLLIDRLTLAETRYKFQTSADEYAPETLDAKRTARNLDKLIQRYASRNIPYRCLISHANVNKEASDALESNQDYEDFINTYWKELNHCTGDFLDVYYDAEYGVSGRDIVRTCGKISPELRGKPLIALWAHDVKQAEGIDIRGLTKAEICELIETIVEYIKADYPFSRIVKEANEVAEEKRNQNRPLQINAKNVGTVYGDMSGGHVGDNVGVQGDELEELLRGFAEAKKRVNGLPELDEDDRDLILSHLERIEQALENGDNETQEKEKKRFTTFLKKFGETGAKVIGALAGIASIARFFGFGV